jgi:cell shape-determining protein MreD
VAAASKRSIASWIPWLAVLLVALLGEAVDMRDDLMSVGHWRWAASLHDVLNTVFWPSVLLLLARVTGILSRR